MGNDCYLCKKTVEFCNHVLFRCSIMYKFLFVVYGLLGVSWVMAGSVRDEIQSWKGISGRKKYVNLIPTTIFWVIWQEGNRRAFERVNDVEDFDRIRLDGSRLLVFYSGSSSILYGRFQGLYIYFVRSVSTLYISWYLFGVC